MAKSLNNKITRLSLPIYSSKKVSGRLFVAYNLREPVKEFAQKA